MAQNAKMVLGVDFEVNTQKLNQLTTVIGTALSQINNTSKKNGMSAEVEKTAYSLTQLKEILTSSWNSKMNQLDLTKVNNGLKQAGLSAQQLKKSLIEYPQIYESFSRQILNSNIQLKESNKLLDKMAVTMANTVRFGISSSIFNNMTGALQKSYQYVQNLDKSLNSIRIVSGYSADYMEKFAKNANKAAQSLGATTLDYTNASLIYAQQGLDADQIEKRTELTLKMANATGDAADEVSSYMTAIWNNFAKGSENLERYADVITALGAATAASSSEIATGLEKFASVGETIGLSYEYATAALATVVATTRQSADVVGTAFKTLFSRIQGLSLGETLEDGTTLNKYSEALNKVGVNIKDQNGELKDMDDILNEMGSKWKTLDKDQKVALAQTVAGVRQYNQMMSLMDNWDFFKQNLDIANNAEGTLEEQQNLYMDSIQAHMNKLSAEWEKLYDTIFDEEAIKSFADVATKALSLVNSYLTGIGGGLKSIAVLGANAANLFSGQIAKAAGRGLENKRIQQQAEDDTALKQSIIDSHSIDGNKIRDEALQVELDAATKIALIRKQLTSEEYNELTNKQKKIGLLEEELKKYEEIKQEAEKAKIKLAKGETDFFATSEKIDILKKGTINSVDTEKTKKISAENVQHLIDKAKTEFSTLDLKSQEKEGNVYLEQIETYEKQKKIIEKYEKIQAEDRVELTKAQQRAYQDEIEKVKQLKQEEEELQTFVKGTTALTSTLVSTWGMIDTVTAKGISNLDKFKAIMMTLIVQGPVLFKNFENVSNLFKGVADGSSGLKTFYEGIKEGINSVILVKNKDTIATGVNTAIEKINNETKAKTIKLNIEEAGSEIVVAKAKNKNANASIGVVNKQALQELSNKKLILSNKNLSASFKGANSGIKGLGASFGTTLAKTGPFIVGIAAVVALAYGGFKTLEKQLRSTGQVLDDEIKDAEKHVKDTKQEVQDLLTNINNYSSAKKTLDGLTEGTIEWYEQITKANEEAQKLIKTWDLVANRDYTIGSNGQIQISDTKLKELSFQSNQKNFQAQAGLDIANARKSQYESEELIRGFSKDVTNKARDQYREDYKKRNNGNIPNNTLDIKLDEQGAYKILNKDNTAQPKDIFSASSLDKTYASNIYDLAVDIDDEVSSYLPKYEKSIKQTQVYLQQYGKNLVLGYGTQGQIEKYNDLSTAQQEIIDKYVARIGMKNTHEGQEFNRNLTFTGFFDANTLHEYMSGRNKDAAYKSANMEKTNGTWYNKDGSKATKKDKDKAIEDYKSGGYTAQDSFSTILSSIERSQNESAKRNFKGESRDYISTAVTMNEYGMKHNQDNINILNKEEFEEYKRQMNERIEEYKKSGIAGSKGLAMQNEATLFMEEQQYKFDNQKRQKQDYTNYNDELEKQANALGTSKKALEMYTLALTNSDKSLKKNSADTVKQAAEQYSFNKAYNESVKTFKDNSDAFDEYVNCLKKGKTPAYDVADAMGEILSSAEEFMGIDLPASLWETTDNFNLLKTMMTGTEKEAEVAYNKLMRLARIETLKNNFGIAKDAAIDFVNEIDNSEPGAKLSQKFNDNLRDMINNSHMTKQEIENTLNSLDIEIPPQDIEMKFADVNLENHKVSTNGSKTVHKYDGWMPNPRYGEKDQPEYREVHYSWTETVDPVDQEFIIPSTANFTYKKDKGSKKSFAQTMTNLSKNNKGSTGSSSKIDKQERQKDPYHDVDIKLKNISNTLKKLQTQEDSLLGGDRVKNLAGQIDQLNKQIAVTGEKIKIARQEEARLQGELKKFGVAFATNGDISNYFAVEQNLYNKMEAARTKYNKKMTDANKKAYETAKENYDNFQKKYKEYDDTHNTLIPELNEQQIEDALTKIEKQVEKMDYSIKLHLDLTDATKEWNEWKRKYLEEVDIDEDIFGRMSSIFMNDFGMNIGEDNKISWSGKNPFIANDGSGSLQQTLTRLQNANRAVWQNTDGSWNYSKDSNINPWYDSQTNMMNWEKYKEDTTEWLQKAEEEFGDFKDRVEEFTDAIIDLMNKTAEAFDHQAELYEAMNDSLNHDITLIQRVYGERAYSQLSKYYNQIKNINVENLKLAKSEADMWERQMNSLEKGSKEYEEAFAHYIEAAKKVAENTEVLIESIKDSFNNSIDEILENINKKLTNGLGLNYTQSTWEMLKRTSKEYLDEQNAAYGVQKLKNEYLKSINESDNLKYQQELRKVMDDELKILEERDKLTQYDLDRAELKYQIALKQIALEEAQRSKTSMRLRRDSQGNYTYQYTADEDKIREVEQEIADLYNQLYNLDLNQYESNLDDIYSLWVEFQQKIKETENIEDEVERQETRAKLYEQYEELLTQKTRDNAQIRDNLTESTFLERSDLYEEDYLKYMEMSEREKDILMNDLVPTWSNAIQTLIDNVISEGGLQQVYVNALEKIAEESEKTATEIQKILDKDNEFSEQYRENVEKNSLSTEELTAKFETQLTTLENMKSTLVDFWKPFLEGVKTCITQTNTLLQTLQATSAEQAKIQAAQTNNTPSSSSASKTTGGSSSSSASKSTGGSSSSSGSSSTAKTTAKKTFTVTFENGYSSGNGWPKKNSVQEGSTVKMPSAPSRSGYKFKSWVKKGTISPTYAVGASYKPNSNVTFECQWTKQTAAQNVVDSIVKAATPIINQAKKLLGFDTGGYTGEWSNTDGRMALLHKKELVLNQEDTKNMLNTVAIMRNITNNVNSGVLAQLAKTSANMGGNGIQSMLGGEIQQDVHITAEFPNVRNSNEIEEALNNLVNRASQSVHTKK